MSDRAHLADKSHLNIHLSDWQIQNLAVPIVARVLNNEMEEFFKNPENERKFQEWYKAKYGVPAPQGV